MNAQQMWEIYSTKENIQANYDAWAFGTDPNVLAQLVLEGKKTATASAYPMYEQDDLPLPQVGEYDIILDGEDNAVCIVRTTNVYVVPFDEVSEDHAAREGEGDRSLAYWRRVHEAFFREELEEANLPFTSRMEVVCEEFLRVFP